MTVTKIEPTGKTKYKIYIDEQFAFVLYKGELSRYHIKEDREIDAQLYEKIVKEVVYKRAKLRTMHLLNDMSRTESEIRTKLKQNLYTADAIDQAIEYVKSFGYIDDSQYARNYVLSKQNSKSKREIQAGLIKKGLDRAVIEEALGEVDESGGEQEAIRAILRKRRYHPETADQDERRKIYAYLARKGFRYDDIQQVLQVSEWNT